MRIKGGMTSWPYIYNKTENILDNRTKMAMTFIRNCVENEYNLFMKYFKDEKI